MVGDETYDLIVNLVNLDKSENIQIHSKNRSLKSTSTAVSKKREKTEKIQRKTKANHVNVVEGRIMLGFPVSTRIVFVTYEVRKIT